MAQHVVLALLGCLAISSAAEAQIAFTSSGLTGESVNNPTSLSWGPDDRLYVTQQNGTIWAFTIQRNAANDYAVIATEQIDLVKNIPNHDDDGAVNSGQNSRQVTGILAVGTQANPVLYVTSSDPRIGAGGGGNDLGLDTNSGIISRLTWNGSSWDHVQLVRGLPRSEENHSTNGMQLDITTNTLYVMSGGHTNKGGPANNFAQTPEYALSAALLTVDLDVVEAMPVLNQLIDGETQYYVYDIPTLDDPTRAGDPDAGDPFGGNDGRNQARVVPGGPVQIYSPGYRNAYDVLLTTAGRLYTFDNGPNGGWGGIPVGEGAAGCTNETNESDSTGYGDGLHFITGPGYYGGHPHPTRGNPEDSDLVIYENQGGWVEVARYDWQVDFASAPPVPFGTGDVQQCDYQAPGVDDQALVVINASTNGMAEYTATNFAGAMQGDLLAASFNGNIYRFAMNATGDTVLNGGGNGEALLGGFGSQPLDVIALGDDEPFPGAIISATYGADNITIFEPNDFLQCDGTNDPLLDEDGDGFDNADEINNGTNPCSAGSQPPDADGDSDSDLEDTDDDNDGTPDTSDPFAIDPDDGTTTSLPVVYPLFNAIPGTGFFGLGFTGLMTDGSTDYLARYDENQLIAGGAAGLFTVEQASAGDAYESNNDQENGFQFGVDVDTTSPLFTVLFRVNSPYFQVGGSASTPIDYQSFGGFIGDGTQDEYLKIVVNSQGGAGGIQVLHETGGVATAASYATGVTGDVLSSIYADLLLTVDPASLTVQPAVSLDGGTIVNLGSPLSIPAAWLSSADAQGLAVGVISTSLGSGVPFGATWDHIEVRAACSIDADCNDGNVCTVDTCTGGICQTTNAIAGTSCNADADLCTIDSCDGGGLCSNDSSVPCGAGEACEPTTGVCENIPTDDDNDGLIATDPCPLDPRNVCFGPVATDVTAGTAIRINAAGTGACAGARTDCNGDTWAADFGFNTDNSAVCDLDGGGESCVIGGISAIFGCDDDATEDLFQCERWDNSVAPELQYDFDVPDGSYVVNLYFANSYTGTAAAGQRVFDILVEGALVYDDFDQVVAAGGSGIAVVRAAVATVNDGNGLQIDFLHVTENPALKAIEVLVQDFCTVDGDCDDGNACTTDSCNAGSCESTAVVDGTSCDDGVACTGADACTAGVCGGGDTCVTGEFCNPSSGLCEVEAAEAFVAVTPTGGLNASTYGADSLQISNDSAGAQEITTVSFDLSSALFPDIVFDPTDGTPAGDAVAKCVEVSQGATETGYVAPSDPCVDPFSGPNENGYYTVTLSFSDFQPGEYFSFAVDIDPTSIQGGATSGAAGSVSGLELTGASVQVTFDGTEVHTASLFKTPTSVGGAQNIVKSSPPGAPTIELVGVATTPTSLTTSAQTVRVTGPAGADVRLLHVEGVMELLQASGFDLEPFEANTAVVVNELSGTIGAGGTLDIPVTLSQTISVDYSDEGLNHFVAVIEDADASGRTGATSSVLVVRYDPNVCTVDGDCDDGLFCNGAETCNGTGACDPGTPPVGDGVACTDDVCDEVNDVVVSTPNDASCNDGLFCTGTETCDAALDCQPGAGDPCAGGDVCDEANDICTLPCLDDTHCDDLLFCNGAETCNTTTQLCEPGTAPAGDGVACTDDVCDEINDVVVSTPNDANCDDALFCNGSETCDAALDCQAGTTPCLASEVCDEVADTCSVPCPGDSDCDGLLDGDDPCALDPFNGCNGATTALCSAATDNCAAIGDPIAFDAGPASPQTACDGSVWASEAGATLGSNYAGNVTIDAASIVRVFGCSDAATETLVASERYGPSLARSYPIANGTYSVSLLFAEAFQGNCDVGAGERLQDVSIEGIEVLSDFDPFAASLAENGVGCGGVVVRSFITSVADGVLDINLDADVSSPDTNAQVKGIKVVEMVGCTLDADCDDADPCTTDTCITGACAWSSATAGTACDDGDACTAPDECDGAGACVPGSAVVCDDGLWCNGLESCDSIAGCLAGTPVDPDDGVTCTTDSCNEALDTTVNAPDDLACDDGDVCTADSCDAVLGCANDPIPGCGEPAVPSGGPTTYLLLVFGLIATAGGASWWLREDATLQR